MAKARALQARSRAAARPALSVPAFLDTAPALTLRRRDHDSITEKQSESYIAFTFVIFFILLSGRLTVLHSPTKDLHMRTVATRAVCKPRFGAGWPHDAPEGARAVPPGPTATPTLAPALVPPSALVTARLHYTV